MDIYNCHLHLFDIDDVPDRFIHPWLMALAKNGWSRDAIGWILRHANPFSKRDLLERYARFLTILGSNGQTGTFDVVRGYYPAGTRFVVLPMDMSRMNAGATKRDITAQHAELAQLRDAFPNAIIPFAALDPRRPDLKAVRDNAFDTLGFKGVKLYPPLGYAPTDSALMSDVYPFCQQRGLPITAHCSRGGVHDASLSAEEAARYADPDQWKAVLKAFPDLRICLAHFGGIDDWRTYLDTPWPHEQSASAEQSWLGKILDMIRSGEYPNLYTDISYTAFYFPEMIDTLKVLLSDPNIQERVLFGSDFYMAEQEELSERMLSIKLRATLGEGLFWQIANTNPKAFLT